MEVLTKRKLLVDAAIAGAFVAAAELEAALGLATRGSWTHALFAPLFLAPLAVRRRIPPLAFVSAVAGLVVLDADAALSLFGAVVLASYSVGAAVEGRLAYLVPATAVALFAVLATGGEAAPSDVVALGLFFGGPWWVGRLVRQRVRQADELVLLAERERERETASAVAEERGRIARELHDIVAHRVTTMVIQAESGSATVGDDDLSRQAFATIADSARQSLDELRTLLGLLREGDGPAETSPPPGAARLDELVLDVREAGLGVDATFEGELGNLPAGIDLTVYRIVQEALTNVLKHGQTRAIVRVVRETDRVLVEVRNPVATSPGPWRNGAGRGLPGMRERVRL